MFGGITNLKANSETKQQHSYNRISGSSEEEGNDFRGHEEEQLRRRYRTWPWIFSTVFFATTTLVSYWRQLKISSIPHNSYEKGFATDLRAAHSEIEIVQVQFSGALSYDENGTTILEYGPGEPVWVGDPTPEIDQLWDSLEAANYIALEGDEADMTRGRSRLENGYWDTGLDVFHQLHCLNSIRKAFYPDYYVRENLKNVHNIHFDHCLNYVRQALLCNADMTPVNIVYYESADYYGPDFHITHTCRNVDRLKDWSLARAGRIQPGMETGVNAHYKSHSL